MVGSTRKRKTVGLALGSGGARGMAHIGVLKSLIRHGITIDYIAGSSMGALVGGMFCTTLDTAPLEEAALAFGYRDMVGIVSPKFSSGILEGTKAKRFIEKCTGERTIEGLSIPFAAVASDIRTAEIIAIRTGKLSNAIWASCTVPFIFQPTAHEGRFLVDGGLTLPVPVPVVREMGADIVVAVNLDSRFFPTQADSPAEKCPSTVSVSFSSLNLLRYHLAKHIIADADIVVSPDVPPTDFRQFVHGEDFIAKGEQAMDGVMPQLRRLLEQEVYGTQAIA